MSASNREQRLLQILARENSKMGPVRGRTPSQFRETMSDTHKTMSAEDFGPHPEVIQTIRNNYATQSAFGAGRRASAPRARPIPGPDQQPVEFRSVFKPRPEQEPVCQLATQRRKLVQNSEWALIDTLEVDMYMREKEARAAALVALQASQRQALDQQMGEVEAARRREERESQQEREVALAETARYKADQARRAAEERTRNIALRNERQNMLQESLAAKALAKAERQREEQKELADIAAQLEIEKQVAAAKTEAQRAQWLKLSRENEARIAARKVVQAEEREKDERLMMETIATLGRQEKEREERAKEFHAMVEARVNRVGGKAVADNKAKLEMEAQRQAYFEAQKEADFKAKEAADAAKRARVQEELAKDRKRAAALRQQKADAAKAALEVERKTADQLARAGAQSQMSKLAAMRGRAAQHQDSLRGQMAERTAADVRDDVGMSDAERQLNARLLDHALRVTGGPKQLSVKLY